ncbi:MAG: zinc ribbon domain-containing protein [Planctomycetota bacterium]
MPPSDWDIAEGLDPEGPSAEDLDRFGDELIPCPHCGRQLYDQVELCPHCGMALERPPARVPAWTIAVVVVMIGLMLMWVL